MLSLICKSACFTSELASSGGPLTMTGLSTQLPISALIVLLNSSDQDCILFSPFPGSPCVSYLSMHILSSLLAFSHWATPTPQERSPTCQISSQNFLQHTFSPCHQILIPVPVVLPGWTKTVFSSDSGGAGGSANLLHMEVAGIKC